MSQWIKRGILPSATKLNEWKGLFENEKYRKIIGRRCFNWTRKRTRQEEFLISFGASSKLNNKKPMNKKTQKILRNFKVY